MATTVDLKREKKKRRRKELFAQLLASFDTKKK